MGDEDDESDYNEQYQRIIERDSSWRQEKNNIKQRLLGELPETEDEIGFKLREGIETSADHDELLQSTISVFDPRGEVCQETGWRIFATEPLAEKDLRNPDALIGNPDRNWAILVECKTGLSSPGKALEQLYDAADAVRNNRDYLTGKTGLQIENIDCVLCVPSQYDRQAAKTISQYERDNQATEIVYVWRLNRFSGETLQLYENIETRDRNETSHDHQVTEFLSGEGVRVSGGSEITPEYFPSSHLANIIEVAFAEILWNRELADDPVTTFTRDELLDFLTSQNNLLHYSADTIGGRIRDEILDRLLDHGLIESHGDSQEMDDIEVFEYGVDGRTMETIKANLTEGYVEAEINQKAETEARKRTVQKFRNEAGRSLDEF
jgi:hypothetical protein